MTEQQTGEDLVFKEFLSHPERKSGDLGVTSRVMDCIRVSSISSL